jgi:Putative viral replication protein
MSKKNHQAKNWCFTLQNWTEEDVERLKQLRDVQYLVCGKEVASTGTPHLQGYVQFKTKIRLAQVQSRIKKNMHCSVARDQEGSITYCKKEGNWFEVGQLKQSNQGKRNFMELFKEAVQSGERNPKKLREDHSKVAAMYPRFFNDYINDNQTRRTFAEHEKRTWQIELSNILNGEPDPRKIIFVVDSVGNTGKTWFCHRYAAEHEFPDNIQIIPPGKKSLLK